MTDRVLLVLTSHDRLGDTGRGTGLYLPEAAHPWRVFTAAGYQVDLVSVRGGQPPVDGFNVEDPVQRAFLADPEMSRQLAATRRPDQVEAADYRAVFYAGGHGAMWDLPHDAASAALARDVYEAGGVVAAVCHGPAGLVDVILYIGQFLVDVATSRPSATMRNARWAWPKSYRSGSPTASRSGARGTARPPTSSRTWWSTGAW